MTIKKYDNKLVYYKDIIYYSRKFILETEKKLKKDGIPKDKIPKSDLSYKLKAMLRNLDKLIQANENTLEGLNTKLLEAYKDDIPVVIDYLKIISKEFDVNATAQLQNGLESFKNDIKETLSKK